MALFPPRIRKTPEAEAADWAARLDGGPLARADEEALQAWIDGGASHQELLDEAVSLYGRAMAAIPAMVQAGELPVRPRRASPILMVGFATAAAVLAVGIVWWFNHPQELSTPYAVRQSVTLSDGTVADLDAHTSIFVSLGRAERRVRLAQGEAYFSVSKDASRPFYVETSAGTVRVTGTHFDVRSDAPANLEVTVLEGTVLVTPALASAKAVILKPQDQFTCDGAAAAARKLSIEAAEDVVAWREGRIVFNGVPLRDAVDRFARYQGREIDVSPDVEGLRLGGSFHLDNFDAFLRDVQAAVAVRVLRTGGGRIRLVSR